MTTFFSYFSTERMKLLHSHWKFKFEWLNINLILLVDLMSDLFKIVPLTNGGLIAMNVTTTLTRNLHLNV